MTDDVDELERKIRNLMKVAADIECDPIVPAADLEVLLAAARENERLRKVLDAVWSFTDLDPEHTISCHTDTLPEAYRQACAALDAAKEAGTPDESPEEKR